jgi:hypothetical protein
VRVPSRFAGTAAVLLAYPGCGGGDEPLTVASPERDATADPADALDAGADNDHSGDAVDAADAPDAGDSADGSDAADAGSCSDGVTNGSETDVDCGGPVCARCDLDHKCVLDGDCKSGRCGRSFCVLASGPPYWLPSVSMPEGCGQCDAAFMPTGVKKGRIFVIGAAAMAGRFATFDAASAAWSSGTMPVPVDAPAAVRGPDAKIYVVSTAGTAAYDGSWQSGLAPFCCDTYPRAALGSDGSLYAVGAARSSQTQMRWYDVTLDRWQPIPSVKPQTVYIQPSMASLGSRVYVLGSGEPLHLRAFEAYDVAAASWSTLANLPITATPTIAAGPDGRIYSIGGAAYMPAGGEPISLDEVDAYDPLTDRWATVAPLLVARAGAAVSIGPDGRLYAIGGQKDNGDYLSSVEVYGPAVAVTPANARAGATVRLRGTNFAANAAVSVYFGPIDEMPLATGATDGTGALVPSLTVSVPSAPAGDRYFTLVDDKSRFPVTVPFTVDASPKTKPSSYRACAPASK